MGDIKRPKKHYRTPNLPWNKKRIEEERELSKEYGFVNKREIWKVESLLIDFKARAKRLIPLTGEIGNQKRQELISKVNRMGIIKETSTIDEILSLTFRDVADRRLQSMVFRKGFARSVKQARQFITHGHVKISGKKITAPCYVVLKEEEENISFSENSPFSNPNHPERTVEKKEQIVVKKEPEKKVEEKQESEEKNE